MGPSDRTPLPRVTIASNKPPPIRCALLLLFLGALTSLAHNPNTSYTRVRILPDAIESRFTFDVTTLSQIAAVDQNWDRQVTQEELDLASPDIFGFLTHHVLLRVDNQPAALGEPGAVEISDGKTAIPEVDYHQTLVHFTLRKPVSWTPEEIYLEYRVFEALGAQHINLASIQEGDTPVTEVAFNQFEPSFDYFASGEGSSLRRKLLRFGHLGVEHIFLGYDHILFLLALLIVSRFWEIVKIVTAFTVAHTITLVLATLQVVTVNSRWIEAGIALTIMYVAIENLWAKKRGHRWLLTFGFGLVHGFGFAGVLRELGLPSQGLVECLVAFNVGVELGQLAIVLALLPLLLLLSRWRHGPKVVMTVSLLIFLFGTAWFVERALGLSFMPI